MRGWVLLHVAAMEWRVAGRARWTGLFAVAFGGLSLAVSYFGMIHAGFSGFVGFTRTAMSLVSLVTLLLPLLGLGVGAVAFGADRESQQLFVAQPLGRAELVVGRYLGLLAALTTASLLGFGIAGVVVALRAGSGGWVRYVGLTGLSTLLLAQCLGLGSWIGTASRDRGRAVGAAVAVWGGLVILYDLVAMGLTVALGGEAARPVLVSMVLANPVDLVRVLALLLVGARESLGAPGAALVSAMHGLGGTVLLPIAAAAWLVLPVAWACRQAQQQDF